VHAVLARNGLVKGRRGARRQRLQGTLLILSENWAI